MSLPLLPRWIAHRGGGTLAPENTLAGIRLAARLGCRAVEFDVMLSADGTPVLMHDETLERTTSGRGRADQTSDRDLLKLDAGGGEKIPRLDEAAALCRQLGVRANIEIKPPAGQEVATAERVCEVAAASWKGVVCPPLISSFSEAALAVVRRCAPEFPVGWLIDRVPDDWRGHMRALEAQSLHCNADFLDDAPLAKVLQAGVPVYCYTVNDPALARACFARGVRGLFSDRPGDFFLG